MNKFTRTMLVAILLASASGTTMAQTDPNAATTNPNATTTNPTAATTTDVQERHDHDFPWGLLGLVGLAGLMGRKRHDDVRSVDHTPGNVRRTS